ncbi:hypothetical protein IQ259_03130 [Fortiea sp. LEGE XX443]|nr:hypothetical protein [Fortiea sp. LEGE XX443]MBE9004047.1 hypothetical protein [Fortiea sp. LEGE XX443]
MTKVRKPSQSYLTLGLIQAFLLSAVECDRLKQRCYNKAILDAVSIL